MKKYDWIRRDTKNGTYWNKDWPIKKLGPKRATGCNSRALGTNPRAKGTNPRAMS